ncbi:hypothetical protein QUF94_12120 [Peribacillus sp. NJ4]|uniref:hypothetical protein n=1 Tax=Peribacillus sp. NJ4 TaxID=3055862 RepID=UPI0025A1A801|nr:hypothetical protein [Peribacillus sp. NJ4]MDM5212187.1 hypothetical protein [Peribacillus sp. NJ4]
MDLIFKSIILASPKNNEDRSRKFFTEFLMVGKVEKHAALKSNQKNSCRNGRSVHLREKSPSNA